MTLNDIIEYDIDDALYLKLDEWKKRKYLKTTLGMCDVVGDDVYLHVDGMKPPQILKLKRTEEEKLRRHRFGDKGKKFGAGMYVVPTGDCISNTLTTFSTDNYLWDRNYKVRELTDYESFRLMGVDDVDTRKILSSVTKSKLRKLSGNSIVVDVLVEIFRNLFSERINPEKSLF